MATDGNAARGGTMAREPGMIRTRGARSADPLLRDRGKPECE